MKTFKQFILECQIAEEYINPRRKSASGTTPLNRAKKKGITGHLLNAVERGANNPSFNTEPHEDLDIVSHSKHHHEITHRPSGVKAIVNKIGTTKSGNTKYGLVWNHNREGNMSDKEAISLGRTAYKFLGKHVTHRFPHGSIVHANPIPTEVKNTRAKLTQRLGFGKPSGSETLPDQYAVRGRNPSPRQAARGVKHLRPIDNPPD